ncbi:MAG: hypothetical protein D9V44_10470 [Actinobacteria bacterium]|nr:MAG: hypothetical protein D9V44_10470 [Actinomycetota bacterium]
MARIIGTPGESAGVRGALFVIVPISLTILLVFLPALYALSIAARRQGLVGLAITGVVVVVVWGFNRKTFAELWEGVREGRNFLKGAQGEILVHQALRELSEEYIVFHDFHPVDASGKPARWNVDHIVIGPTGIFVLDAKYYSKPRVFAAEKNSFNRKNVAQVQRNAMELKERLVKWSGGELTKLFVVPVVVYAQPDASLEKLNEGAVRTIPLRLLPKEITSHTEGEIDRERAGRVARVLYSQIGRDLQYAFKTEFDAYGELSRAARYAARDARLVAQAAVTAEQAVTVVEEPPTSCPRCGGALVRRTARFGERAGKPFLGCENYSKTGCRFGWNLEE